MAASEAPAAAQPPGIRHSPPTDIEAWHPLTIHAVLLGNVSPELIATADVVVSTADGGLRPIPLTVSGNAMFGEVPGALVAPPELAYYLRVVHVDGVTASAPPGAPSGGLFTIAVKPAEDPVEAGGSPQWATQSVEVLNPAAGEVVLERTPQIAAVLDPPLEEPWDALIVLDGDDVSSAATVTPEFFVLVPDEPLADGAHRITFSAATPTGVVESSWVFFVMEKTEDAAGQVRWPSASADEDDEWPPSGSPATEWVQGRPDEEWQVSGRLEAGWAVVAAETTAVESTDVFLPYPEVNRPSVDFYLSGVRGDGTLLITARQDPVYGDDLEWLVSAANGRFEVNAGQIFPSLSHSTLNWAAGNGVSGAARVGRSTTELLGMRLSEADTLAGFGIYSRFAVGAKESFDWSDRLSASVVYLSVFDREDSVPEAQKLSEPLRNSVVAGVVRTSRGGLMAEVEAARSVVSGEEDGRGMAFRAEIALERDWHNRVSLEYASSEPDFHSAGSYEYDPG
ncbi:MAG TPA: hypothetical protein VE960_00820, partial [bacterium]|nr:hypothetical protein [bacterium]